MMKEIGQHGFQVENGTIDKGIGGWTTVNRRKKERQGTTISFRNRNIHTSSDSSLKAKTKSESNEKDPSKYQIMNGEGITTATRSWSNLKADDAPSYAPYSVDQGVRTFSNSVIHSPSKNSSENSNHITKSLNKLCLSPSIFDIDDYHRRGRLFIRPRGFSNYGNMCFLNAVLQTLIHCPLLFGISRTVFNEHFKRENGNFTKKIAPFWSSFIDVISTHRKAEHPLRILNSMTKNDPNDNDSLIITPESLYTCLQIKRPFHRRGELGSFQGLQEDAQEFLTFIIDQLHEELVSLSRKNESITEKSDAGTGNDKNDEEWMEVGRNKKVSLTRSMQQINSPISDIFFGRFRSVLKKPNMRRSITSEPFHCISLEIGGGSITDNNGSKISSIEDALMKLTISENINGNLRFTKQLLLEVTPPILILHLKRFQYSPKRGIAEKIERDIYFPEYLELSPAILSNKQTQRYRLFSVIYHIGRNSEGGHYTCHVRQSPINRNHGFVENDDDTIPWIYFDDSEYHLESVERIIFNASEQRDRNHRIQSMTPYLLFYEKF